MDANRLRPEDCAAHDWYRFVLSYPPHLVRDYLARFGATGQSTVLDPFCGTGTTLVECKKLGVPSIGVEASPMAHFAAAVKTDWTPDAADLANESIAIAESARSDLSRASELCALPPDSYKILLAGSISPLPLHKTLILLRHLNKPHHRLALAKALVGSIGNLHFGPEIGVTAPKADAPVLESWLQNIAAIAADLEILRPLVQIPSRVIHGDARKLDSIEPGSIDAVITSPPYPNEKDYTRTTRLESVLLGFIAGKADLRALKKGLIRSNTRNVYHDDDDDQWVASHPEIQRIAREIEARRIELKKTSGFERLYHRVTRHYFGGMARHLQQLKPLLKPGARLAYVVGDQASFLRVMIRTGKLISDLAAGLGYEVQSIDLFRTRLATATGQQLREEVVVLRWPG